MARHLHISFLALAIFATVAIAGTTTTQPAGNNYSFLKKACNGTLYPSLCYASLYPYSHKVKSDPRELAIAATFLAINAASNTTAFLTSLREKTTGREHRVINLCEMMFGDSTEALEDSMQELKRPTGHVLNYVLSQMSGALTSQSTCADEFVAAAVDIKNEKMKVAIGKETAVTKKLTSIALALVRQYARPSQP